MPDNQAEALVELMAQQHEDVATKADIAALNTTINATINDKIAMINDKMATKTDIAEVKTQLLISMIALGGVMIATIKLF